MQGKGAGSQQEGKALLEGPASGDTQQAQPPALPGRVTPQDQETKEPGLLLGARKGKRLDWIPSLLPLTMAFPGPSG